MLLPCAGEIGFSAALEELSSSLFNGKLPPAWARLNPATEKPLGPWMAWFTRRHEQYKVQTSMQAAVASRACWVDAPQEYRVQTTSPLRPSCIMWSTSMACSPTIAHACSLELCVLLGVSQCHVCCYGVLV